MVCSGYFIFVGVNEVGKAIPVPPLHPVTEDDKLTAMEAEQRKELRAKMQECKCNSQLTLPRSAWMPAWLQ